MSSFLQKLRGKGVVDENAGGDAAATTEGGVSDTPMGVTQLPVDVYQSDIEIVIYAQVPGTDMSSLDVSIEGDNDVITIQGSSKRPEELAHQIDQNKEEKSGEESHTEGGTVPIHIGGHSQGSESGGEFSFEECAWGQFFRQIILPQDIDAEHAQAKIRDGVLVLKLPLKVPDENKIKMDVVKVDSQ